MSPSVPDAPDPWSILRSACAQLDPRIQQLERRLAGPDGAEWLQQLQAQPNAVGDPEALLVADALNRAERLLAGDPVATEGVDDSLLRQVWMTLAEAAPKPIARLAESACVALEKAPGIMPSASDVPFAPIATSRVGSYELVSLLGAGAFGAVYRARHRDNGMAAAVKFMRLDALGTDSVERFRNEARIASRLRHPAIVRLLDSGVHEQGWLAIPYLVSEFVEGKPFAEALRGAPTGKVLETFAELCEAVGYAHGAGVLHRDLKPDNVLVDGTGHPHVLDFGTARCIDLGSGSRTATGRILGTPAYMSPEQAAGHAADVRSDVWSLGALLFAALTGETPHALHGVAILEALRVAAEAQPRRVESLRADLGGELEAVLGKALAYERGQRYSGAEDLARDVRRLIAGDPVSAHLPSSWQLLRRWTRRHRLATVTAVSFAGFLLGGGIVVGVLWRQAVGAAERLDRGASDALIAVQSALQIASRLAETITAAKEQADLLEPAIAAVVSLQGMSLRDHQRWLQVESGMREVAGDMALRAQRFEAARSHRARVLSIEEGLAAAASGNPRDLARAMVKCGDLDWEKRRDQARSLYEASHEVLLLETARTNASLASLDDLSWSFHRLSGIALTEGRSTEARALAGQHLQLAERMIAMSADGLRQFNLAEAIVQWLKCNEGSDEDAARFALLERARHCGDAAVQAEPDRRPYLLVAQHATQLLASACITRSDLARARSLLERAASLADKLLAADADDLEAGYLSDRTTATLASVARRLSEKASADARDPAAAIQLARQAGGRLRPATEAVVVEAVVAVLRLLGLEEEVASARLRVANTRQGR